MRYFFDTEFIEDGKTIDMISIGIVAEDGREFYACSTEARLDLSSEWVRCNVLPHLPQYGSPAWATRAQIRDGLLAFVGADTSPEFWAYCADYDWVVFCQLFGTMMDLPKHFPKWCRDLKQLSWSLGSPKHPKDTDVLHDALADAKWNRDLFDTLMAVKVASK